MRYKNKKTVITAKQGAALLTAIITAVFTCLPFPAGTALAADAVNMIATPDDLIELSRQCVFDDYSKGKIFELANDIDLKEVVGEFEPIPSFGGTFRGNGYKITLPELKKTGSDAGLFRFIEEEGVVENLTVSLHVRPGGSQSNIGVIVGTNRGRISSCKAEGSVRAKENAGGIAGFNEGTGLIEGCVNEAEVSSLKATGGIAGKNDGIIETCTNLGAINTTDHSEEEEEETQTTDMSFRGGLLEAEKVYHTGGIVGRSIGLIRGCVNEGNVGYPHAGYNTGGIVGLQSGCVTGCENRGSIWGRKDTGGIVGQFEPYIKISYEEDLLQTLQNQTDELLNRLDRLGDLIGDTSDQTVNMVDATRNDIKNIRSILQDNKKYYYDTTREFSDTLDNRLDNINESLDRIDPELEKSSTKSDLGAIHVKRKRLKALQEEFPKALVEDRARAKQILEEMSNLLKEIGQKTVHIPTAIVRDINDTEEDIAGQVDDLRNSLEDAVMLIQDNQDQLFEDLKDTNSQLVPQFDNISADLDGVFEIFKHANTDIQNQVSAIQDQMAAIQDTIDGRMDEWKEKRDEELVDDISDVETSDTGNGLVLNCVNRGLVETDSNGGGIVGIIGMEMGLDPESDIEVDGDSSLKMSRTARATVQGSKNYSRIRTKNDYAGGIAGRADFGALIVNQNYGNIESEDGSYVGGIAGKSSNVIRGSYSLCELTGKDYLGGIVGLGQDVKANYAMADVYSESGEYHGCIAGAADGEVSGNFFVWEKLPAVNGVNYKSQASALTYEELLAREQTPEEFRQFHIRFVADGELVSTFTAGYRQTVANDEIPEVPVKEGYYGEWDQEMVAAFDCVTRNLTVQARYYPWTTTIASDLKEGALPVLLAEGEFYSGTLLKVTETEVPVESGVEGFEIRKAYQYQIIPVDGEHFETFYLRILTEEGAEHVSAAKIENGAVIWNGAEPDGKYVKLSAQSGEGTIVLLEKKSSPYLLAVILTGCAVVLAGAVVIRKKSRKRGSKELPESESEEKRNELNESSEETGDGEPQEGKTGQ